MKLHQLILIVILYSCNVPEPAVINSEIKNPESGQPIILSKKLTESNVDLRLLSLSELRLLRNEVYARKGYIFKSENLTKHFQKYQWYKPKYEANEVDNYLTEVDKSNINWILSIEDLVRPKELAEEISKSVTFRDFLELIPDIKLPTNLENWDYVKSESDITHNDTLRIIWNKYERYSSTFGKIRITDSLFAIGINHASDLYMYTTFFIVNSEGDELESRELPLSFSTTADLYDTEDEMLKDTVTEYYKDVIITEDLNMIVSSWEKTLKYDSLEILIDSQLSDTIVTIENFY